MSYMKFTKPQLKNQERIEAWLKGVPFRENSRDRNPQVPDLTLERVLEEFCPPDVKGAGQFYTPLEMAAQALAYISPHEGARILEPCAGIGNLLYPLLPHANRIQVDAYEMEWQCVEVGRKLFPWACWQHAIPFADVAVLEGRYDFVVMNPPFGTQRGLVSGEEMSQGRATRSEHIFVELAVRALKPGGQAVLIVPSQGERQPPFHARLPKKLAAWFEPRATVVYRDANLPGEFQFTKITVEALIIERTDFDAPVAAAAAAVTEPAPAGALVGDLDPPADWRAVPDFGPPAMPPPAAPVLALIGQYVTWKAGAGKVVNVSRNGQTLFIACEHLGKSRIQSVRFTDIQA